MKKKQTSKRINTVPDKAVLLIPEPENENEPVPYGVKPGYYDSKQMLQLLEQHKDDADAIQFIADMLETGNSEDDGFAKILKSNRSNPAAITGIIQTCKKRTAA